MTGKERASAFAHLFGHNSSGHDEQPSRFCAACTIMAELAQAFDLVEREATGKAVKAACGEATSEAEGKLIRAVDDALVTLQIISKNGGLSEGGEQRGNWLDVQDMYEKLKWTSERFKAERIA